LEKHLHIVAFDVPYPPNYGGVIPIFSLLQCLKEKGVLVHLHCFEYGRGPQPELDKFCSQVNYYSRRKGLKGLSLQLPYIVSSRINQDLKENLLKDKEPILFEGIHCSYLALDPAFKRRKIGVRLHNVEHNYYKHLYKASSGFWERNYYYLESLLLKKYERKVARSAKLIAISNEDKMIYQRRFAAKEIAYVPPAIPYTTVNSQPGLGGFCLYHGNLSVAENEKAAAWLASKVFDDLSIPLTIAGKNPGEQLKKIISCNSNVKLIENPSDDVMQQLIASAQINVLPSFNSTGIKLKLLNALFNGRHCVVNAAMACASELVTLCHIADDENEFKSIIRSLYAEPFSESEISTRKNVLLKIYDNATNTQSLLGWIC
jgi:glycosyltransferase involved in cell wall biosynthesis